MLNARDHGLFAPVSNEMREVLLKPFIRYRGIILIFHGLIAGRVGCEVLAQQVFECVDDLFYCERSSQ